MNLQRIAFEVHATHVFRFVEHMAFLAVVAVALRGCGRLYEKTAAGACHTADKAVDSAERSVQRACMASIQCSNKLRVTVVAFPRAEQAPEVDYSKYGE